MDSMYSAINSFHFLFHQYEKSAKINKSCILGQKQTIWSFEFY